MQAALGKAYGQSFRKLDLEGPVKPDAVLDSVADLRRTGGCGAKAARDDAWHACRDSGSSSAVGEACQGGGLAGVTKMRTLSSLVMRSRSIIRAGMFTSFSCPPDLLLAAKALANSPSPELSMAKLTASARLSKILVDLPGLAQFRDGTSRMVADPSFRTMRPARSRMAISPEYRTDDSKLTIPS